ncbi:hypothetical protein [Alicyclobacillus pomorum]|uniref:hypothetical protein n=1 Tax=Alicyclobacillus pomorum TaxID=204470 RepID=UPI0004132C20|nr:hypothetical protein [Alicyclobacillus pomorum]
MATFNTFTSPEEFQAYGAQLFTMDDVGKFVLFDGVKPEVEAFYADKWPGLIDYCRSYTSEWSTRSEVGDMLYKVLRRPVDRDMKAETILASLRLWGMQVVADFVAAVCLLEADADVYGNHQFILQKIRKHTRSYSTYLSRREQELHFGNQDHPRPGEGFYLALPLLREASGFFRWSTSTMNAALACRKPAILTALEQWSTDDIRVDAGNATLDVIFNLAVIAGYMAYRLDFKRYYASQR